MTGQKLLDYPTEKKNKKTVDLDQFWTPTERGKNADEYMREMRGNDRL